MARPSFEACNCGRLASPRAKSGKNERTTFPLTTCGRFRRRSEAALRSSKTMSHVPADALTLTATRGARPGMGVDRDGSRPEGAHSTRQRFRLSARKRKPRCGKRGFQVRRSPGDRGGDEATDLWSKPRACFTPISSQQDLVSRFAAESRPAFRSLWRQSGVGAGWRLALDSGNALFWPSGARLPM